MKPIPDDAIQCAAERPVAGPPGAPYAMYGLLRCYLFDGHDGPHNDCTEGITWKATRLSCGGHLIRDTIEGRTRGHRQERW